MGTTRYKVLPFRSKNEWVLKLDVHSIYLQIKIILLLIETRFTLQNIENKSLGIADK